MQRTAQRFQVVSRPEVGVQTRNILSPVAIFTSEIYHTRLGLPRTHDTPAHTPSFAQRSPQRARSKLSRTPCLEYNPGDW